MQKPLLPSGLFDLLPPQAEQEARIVGTLLSHFRACGYAQVSPPMMEFEDSLLTGSGDDVATKSFRVMDPLSQRMMALRADMTMQIARIAGHLLTNEPRPLRLCYNGQTLRTSPDAMRHARQFRQIGIECFGEASLLADIEVIQTAVSAVRALGLTDLTLDINYGAMLDALTESWDAPRRTELVAAVRRKDTAAIAMFGEPVIGHLVAASGSAAHTLAALDRLCLPAVLTPMLQAIRTASTTLNDRLENSLPITIDPLEMHGFGYYSGISFALYLKSSQREIGRGGRYITHYGETASGFTLYSEDLLSVAPAPDEKPRKNLPPNTTEAQAQEWRDKGYITVYGFDDQKRQS